MQKWESSAPTEVLRFPNKYLRSLAIAKYLRAAGYTGAVVFTCGNAADALRQRFVSSDNFTIVEVGPRGTLKTDKWWTPAEIHSTWPALFDATSGHLTLPLMLQVAVEFKRFLLDKIEIGKQYYVPTGSGESIVCLHVAFPNTAFCAVYDNSEPSTTRDPEAPLNKFVDDNFRTEYWPGTLGE